MSQWMFLRRGIITYYEEWPAVEQTMELEQTTKAVPGTQVILMMA